MYSGKPLNIFYSEPDPDRWLPYDRYPRRIIRRIVRGKPKWGGVQQVAISLMKGLGKLGIDYRFNDYSYIKQHPEEIACIIGKPHVLFDKEWKNPIIFGPGIYSHPIDCPNLFKDYPNVKRFLVPGEWMFKMCKPYYGDKVVYWPAGIDTERWQPCDSADKQFDFLIYDKVRWEHDRFEKELIEPIKKVLDKHERSHQVITYGKYNHGELTEKLKKSKAVIFLCEHETQGLAYQQILATNTPILAWDRGGYWQDPEYFPKKVKYQPVSSVPYWDGRCGIKFTGADDFEKQLETFLSDLDKFKPRGYIMENLTLEKCAEKYLKIYKEVEKNLT
jgi:glycosyltransferase involved in cell wall biosynthesis